jgi:hypothetical protein
MSALEATPLSQGFPQLAGLQRSLMTAYQRIQALRSEVSTKEIALGPWYYRSTESGQRLPDDPELQAVESDILSSRSDLNRLRDAVTELELQKLELYFPPPLPDVPRRLPNEFLTLNAESGNYTNERWRDRIDWLTQGTIYRNRRVHIKQRIDEINSLSPDDLGEEVEKERVRLLSELDHTNRYLLPIMWKQAPRIEDTRRAMQHRQSVVAQRESRRAALERVEADRIATEERGRQMKLAWPKRLEQGVLEDVPSVYDFQPSQQLRDKWDKRDARRKRKASAWVATSPIPVAIAFCLGWAAYESIDKTPVVDPRADLSIQRSVTTPPRRELTPFQPVAESPEVSVELGWGKEWLPKKTGNRVAGAFDGSPREAESVRFIPQ